MLTGLQVVLAGVYAFLSDCSRVTAQALRDEVASRGVVRAHCHTSPAGTVPRVSALGRTPVPLRGPATATRAKQVVRT